MKLFLLLFAAHICADFIIYSPKLSSEKRLSNIDRLLKALFLHCLYHFVSILLWLIPYDIIFKLKAALYITSFHFIIDLSRIYIEKFVYEQKYFTILKRKDVLFYLAGNKNTESAFFLNKYLIKWILMNIGDQGLHVAAITGFVIFYA